MFTNVDVLSKEVQKECHESVGFCKLKNKNRFGNPVFGI